LSIFCSRGTPPREVPRVCGPSPTNPESIMAHIRQSRPDSGLGFPVKVLTPFQGVSSSLGGGLREKQPARSASERRRNNEKGFGPGGPYYLSRCFLFARRRAQCPRGVASRGEGLVTCCLTQMSSMAVKLEGLVTCCLSLGNPGVHLVYRGTSLIRNNLPLGLYCRHMPRALW